MDILAAKRAGEIAKNIDDRIRLKAVVDLAIAEGWPIVEVLARNPITNETKSLIVSALNDATSQAGLGFIKTVYEGEIAALQADLATAEAWVP